MQKDSRKGFWRLWHVDENGTSDDNEALAQSNKTLEKASSTYVHIISDLQDVN